MTHQINSIDDRKISIVMISLNEELAIRGVVTAIQHYYPHAEIIVVDSSTDKTAEIAQELGCTVIKQFEPKGYGFAMDTALKTASREIVITLDCDNTYPVSAIATLVTTLDHGYDLVSASRLEKRPKAMPWENYAANCFFALLAKIISGVCSTDVHTGMRGYRKTLLSQLPYDPSGPALPVELQVAPAFLGFRCAEIFIDYHEREGKSKLKKIASTLWTIKRLWRWRWFFNSKMKRVKNQFDQKKIYENT